MASKDKCPFCGAWVRSDQKRCPDCGGINSEYTARPSKVAETPRTIEEFRAFCEKQGMKLERMRFFLGEDFREPKAFGIYRDGEDVVVYKNKADGTRAIRYKGPDEEYGVNELYQKLLDECRKRGVFPDGTTDAEAARAKDAQSRLVLRIILGAFLGFALLFVGIFMNPSLTLEIILIVGGFALFFVPVWLAAGALYRHYFPQRSWPGSFRRSGNAFEDEAPLTLREKGVIVARLFRYGPPKKSAHLSGVEARAARRLRWVPGALRALVCSLIAVGLMFSLMSATNASHRAKDARTAQRIAEMSADDGYYDFGDGYLYYCNFGNWFFTKADGSSEAWAVLRYSPQLPEDVDPFHLRESRCFLGETWDPSWPGQPYSSALTGKSGYYDFGDGQIYYLDHYRWFYAAKGGSNWHEVYSYTGSDDYHLLLQDGSSVSALDYHQYYLTDRWEESLGVGNVVNSRVWEDVHSSPGSSTNRDDDDRDRDDPGSSGWDPDDTDWDPDW